MNIGVHGRRLLRGLLCRLAACYHRILAFVVPYRPKFDGKRGTEPHVRLCKNRTAGFALSFSQILAEIRGGAKVDIEGEEASSVKRSPHTSLWRAVDAPSRLVQSEVG